jgi:hypothetical protein
MVLSLEDFKMTLPFIVNNNLSMLVSSILAVLTTPFINDDLTV